MYIIVARKDVGPNSDLKNSSVEYAFRVVSKITGYKLYSNTYTWFMKVPEKLGNMDVVRKFYIYEPLYIENDNEIPSELTGVETFKREGGTKENVGFGFLTFAMEEHSIAYDKLDVKSL
ncbi:MAG: hypothetical protein WC936_07175 [Candidatus Nanoarchaeia archaeon]|jgi:hypothetical protein|nr:hypothetical protein [Clostridia bacterium]